MQNQKNLLTLEKLYPSALLFIFKFVSEISLLSLRETHRHFSQIAIMELFWRTSYISSLLQARLVERWVSQFNSVEKEIIFTWINQPYLTTHDRINCLILLTRRLSPNFELEEIENEPYFSTQLTRIYSPIQVDKHFKKLTFNLKMELGNTDLNESLTLLKELSEIPTDGTSRWAYEDLSAYLHYPEKFNDELKNSNKLLTYYQLGQDLTFLAARLRKEQIEIIFNILIGKIHNPLARTLLIKLVPNLTKQQIAEYVGQLLILLQHQGSKQCFDSLEALCQIASYLTIEEITNIESQLAISRDSVWQIFKMDTFFKLATKRMSREHQIDFIVWQLQNLSQFLLSVEAASFMENYGYRQLLISLINLTHQLTSNQREAFIEQIYSISERLIDFAGETFKYFIELWAPSFSGAELGRFFDQTILIFCHLEGEIPEWGKMQVTLDIINKLASHVPDEITQTYSNTKFEGDTSNLIHAARLPNYSQEKRSEFLASIEKVFLEEAQALSENTENIEIRYSKINTLSEIFYLLPTICHYLNGDKIELFLDNLLPLLSRRLGLVFGGALKVIIALAPRLDERQTEKVITLLLTKLEVILDLSEELSAQGYHSIEDVLIYFIVAKRFDFENFIKQNHKILSEQAQSLIQLSKIVSRWMNSLEESGANFADKKTRVISASTMKTDCDLIETLKFRFFNYIVRPEEPSVIESLFDKPIDEINLAAYNDTESEIGPKGKRLRPS